MTCFIGPINGQGLICPNSKYLVESIWFTNVVLLWWMHCTDWLIQFIVVFTYCIVILSRKHCYTCLWQCYDMLSSCRSSWSSVELRERTTTRDNLRKIWRRARNSWRSWSQRCWGRITNMIQKWWIWALKLSCVSFVSCSIVSHICTTQIQLVHAGPYTKRTMCYVSFIGFTEP